MILNETEVTERMESPNNLLNRLRSITNRHSRESNIIPVLPPSASEVIDNLEEKLAYGSVKSKAAGIMIQAMDELKTRIPEVQKPDQLARIAESMSKIVSAETKEKTDDQRPQFIVYAPSFNREEHYEVMYARE